MTNYRDPAPAPAPDAAPPPAPPDGTPKNPYPYGYGRWRCPVCGERLPMRQVSASSPSVPLYESPMPGPSVTLRVRHLGCMATWHTEPYGFVRFSLSADRALLAFVGVALIFFSLTIIYYFSGTQ